MDAYAGNEADARDNSSGVFTALNALLDANPTGTTANKSNVKKYLQDFSDAIAQDFNIAYGFIIPNVFLWDPNALLGASGRNKWKHLYVVGNANVVFDTGCIKTPEGAKGFVMILDEVVHDATVGSADAARLIQFGGCSANSGNNSGSISNLSITLMDCVPDNRKNPTWCGNCENEDNTTTSNCYYYGANPVIGSGPCYDPSTDTGGGFP